jgi:Electron transfer flavoprotein, alpha subunit
MHPSWAGYGASKVLHANSESMAQMDSQVYAAVIAEVAQKNGATVVVLSHTSTGKSIAGRLAVRLNAGLVSGQTPSRPLMALSGSKNRSSLAKPSPSTK